MTMMTFETKTPKTCGIVELDEEGVVQQLHEKVANPPGNLANGAVYAIGPEVLQWVNKNPGKTDFSTDVLPHFLGRISTWHNSEIHRDIGTVPSLLAAQSDPPPLLCWPEVDDWQSKFKQNPIHRVLRSLA